MQRDYWKKFMSYAGGMAGLAMGVALLVGGCSAGQPNAEITSYPVAMQQPEGSRIRLRGTLPNTKGRNVLAVKSGWIELDQSFDSMPIDQEIVIEGTVKYSPVMINDPENPIQMRGPSDEDFKSGKHYHLVDVTVICLGK